MFKKRHGHAGTKRSPTYNTWRAMRQRCQNPNHDKYSYYGARGITVHDDWNTFDNFLKDMGERPRGKTLDRIDPDKSYGPDNCRWATKKQQANNKRANEDQEDDNI